MTVIHTDFSTTREDAHRLRFEKSLIIPATNVQDAIDLVAFAAIAPPRLITGSSGTVAVGEVAIGISRVAPSATAIALPSITGRYGLPLRIFDWSTSVVDHLITLTPSGAEKIMQQSTWTLASNEANLASVTLWPAPDINGWYIA